MPKVLWVIHGDEEFGERRAIVSLMKGVQASGWTVEAISMTAGGCVAALAANGLPATNLEMSALPSMHKARGKPGRVWEAIKLLGRQRSIGPKVRREIADRQAEVVHILAKNLLPGVAWAARKARVPCFWEMIGVLGTGYPLNLNQRLHKWLIQWFDIHPLANSRFTASTLGEVGRAVDVMYLGVDPQRFDPGRRFEITRASLGLSDSDVVFLIAARPDPRKGQAIFLEAMLQTGNPAVHLLLVGCGADAPESRRIQAIADAAGASRRIHFVAFTEEPEAYVALSDVVVNAGTIPEGFGLSVVEAMMMGKPLLVHALGGPAETVLDGETGWHVNAPTKEAFRAGIERAIQQRDRWALFGEAGRRRALECFSISAQVHWYRERVLRQFATRLRDKA